jgi:hypothetical protein
MARVLGPAAWCCTLLAVVCLVLGVVAAPVGVVGADEPPNPSDVFCPKGTPCTAVNAATVCVGWCFGSGSCDCFFDSHSSTLNSCDCP